MFSFQVARGQSAGNAVTDLLLSAYSPRNFTAEPVTDQQIDLILKCGIKAPSARNLQPWRFTVVRDEPSMKDIIGNAVAGNVLILVSGPETQERGTPDFDCGWPPRICSSQQLRWGWVPGSTADPLLLPTQNVRLCRYPPAKRS